MTELAPLAFQALNHYSLRGTPTDSRSSIGYSNCMPRTARSFQKALCYHVMNRGVNRQSIFIDDQDRQYFSRTVSEYKDLCGAKVYHWVWMGNHYHMLIEIVFENLHGFVGGIQQAYAQYHHARHNGTGVFWQGRFKSKPVEVGSYLSTCGRYIERNPVRAGLSVSACDYMWSSANSYVRKVNDQITNENPYMGGFSDEDRIAYGEALEAGIDDAVVRSVEGERAIGSKEFASTLKKERGHYRLKHARPVKQSVRVQS